MAERPSKASKKEGTLESSVKTRSDIREHKSRSPILTRSRSRVTDDALGSEKTSAISQRSKRSNPDASSSESNNKKIKVAPETSKKSVPDKAKNRKSHSTKADGSSSKPSTSKSKKENHSKKTGSTHSSSKKPVNPEPSTSKQKTIKKSNSLEEIKAKESIASSSNKPIGMDQNGANLSNNNETSTNASANGNNNEASTNTTSAQISASTSSILSTYALSSEDIDESDMSRLQTILESRGLPPHLLGIPRMHNLFYRSFNNSSNTKATQLLTSLNSATNEMDKLQCVMEMCQLLLMGNEDTLVGFPIKSVVPALINLLSNENNFEIMNHACRALTYMMEALPRSSVVVLDAIPVFLEKLQVIQCMDVAEQSLSALEMLSRRHNKAILQARGVSACLTYLDFFSIDAQRSALTITANCFQNLIAEDFQYVQDSLPILSSHLSIEDKKCIESICLAFYRLVECYQSDCAIISEIASTQLLTNIQTVLMTIPSILSTGCFVQVIHMLSIMCLSCSQIAVELLKLNICETLKVLLLCNNSLMESSDTINLISRSPQEICELTSFIAELMPSLPLDGIFSVDTLFSKTNCLPTEIATWQWKDDRGLWQAFNTMDNKIIEAAHQSGEDELELATMSRTYIVDFNSMQKICEETGNSYAIQRKSHTYANSELITRSNMQNVDPRSEFINKEPELSTAFIKFIFRVLTEVYNNSAGYSVRYKCLNATLRIIYYSPKELLDSILKDQSMSSSIATMLASPDLRIVVCAVQMCNILMEKLPEVFSIYFQREGVIHQIRKLYLDDGRFTDKSMSATDPTTSKASGSAIVYSNTQSFLLENAQMILNRTGESFSHLEYIAPSNLTISQNSSSTKSTTKSTTNGSDGSGRIEENTKRKRTRKCHVGITTSSRTPAVNMSVDSSTPPADNNNGAADELNICTNLSSSSYMNFPFIVAENLANLTSASGSSSSSNSSTSSNSSSSSNSSNTTNANNNSTTTTTTSSSSKSSTRFGSKEFLQRLNPTRWARQWNSSSSTTSSAPTTSSITAKDLTSLQKSSNANREKIKTWIKEQAKIFYEKYFFKESEEKDSTASSNILSDLSNAIKVLKEDSTNSLVTIKKILLDTDLSSFELIHSGIVKNLLNFLVSPDSSHEVRENNMRTFLNIFYGTPVFANIESLESLSLDSKPLLILVNKLNACLSQLEQFPIRVQDYSASSSHRGNSALKFLSTNLLKVNLNRYPSCTNLRRYKGPMIKLDPFTPVQSIERYLLARGYGKVKDNDEEPSDEDVSDEDLLENFNIASSSQAQGRGGRLQLLIGDQVLPSNMSIYQAVKQFLNNEHGENDIDEPPTSSKFWNNTFHIYYRLPTDINQNGTSASSNGSSSNSRTSRRSKKSVPKKKDELWIEGKVPKTLSPLEHYLKTTLTINCNINEQAVEVVCLLRVLYGLTRHWGSLFNMSSIYGPIVPLKEFINYKLTVKANRQLQDSLVVMTGMLPSWLSELAYACPFMFPFDTRYILFYVVCFDRDRAAHRLLEMTPELAQVDTRDRMMVPRLEKRKKIVSRNDIMKGAENLFNDSTYHKSLLEIQYENEVGTGLGPTLEFYSLVSKEFQRADLELWSGDVIDAKNDKSDTISYVHKPNGLFPIPMGRNVKPSAFNKTKQRFKLLGKFMAKALIDSRMIDIPLNPILYKWLLNEESSLSFIDLHQLDSTIFNSLAEIHKMAKQKCKLNVNNNHEMLKTNGCSIEDLALDFTLPGHASFELRKGGRDMPVTLANAENYIDLVSHWSMVEGVIKQMEAFKEGFNSLFDSSRLKLFYSEEMQQLFCGSTFKSWDVKMLMETCKADHGFTHESKSIRNLFEILSSYNAEEQRKFLQFLTGSPRLPIGGFKSLVPPFTIVRKSVTESDNPNCLPSVMTCVNYLKLPDYPTKEIMREKLNIAINEGQYSFHLS